MPFVTRSSIQGFVYNQETEPANMQNGDIWVKTSTGATKVKVNGNLNNIGLGVGEVMAVS